MFIVFVNKSGIYQSQVKMLRRTYMYCHCDHNTKDCFYTVEDVLF